MIKDLIKRNRFIFKLALDYKESKTKKSTVNLNKDEKLLLDELKKNGVVTIPNFYTEDECQLMIDEFEKIDDKYAKYYQNDKRIFGIEKLSKVFKKLHHENELFKRIGEAYVGDELILQTTMAAKIVPKSNENFGSGGGWHRDSFSRQFKVIAYLDNVGMDNGPFMYIKGSHKMENIKKIIDNLEGHIPGDYRYTNDEIKRCQKILDEEITYFTAPKGTLLLADVRGLHTGMPIKEGHRYAVFNYYIAKSFHQPDNEIEQLAKENGKK
jgi:glutaredoxin-related protein